MIIGLILVVVIVCIAALALSGNSLQDNDPRHIVVADTTTEPEYGFNSVNGWGSGHINKNTLIYSTLFKTDANGTFVNDLATGYNISSDGLTWTVDIRGDVKFSNNKSLDAEDVAFTFNEAKNAATDLDLTNLENAVAVDNNTIEFNLATPKSSFIYDLRYLGIVSQEDYNNETYGENPIGSGPYVLKEWNKGQQAIFEYNPSYYGDEPYYNQITLIFPDDSSVLELVRSGEVDVASVSVNALNETIDGYYKINLSANRAQGISLPYLPDTGNLTEDGLPIGNNVTSDKAIRDALNIGINRSSIVETVFKGYGDPEYTGLDSRPFANSQAAVEDGNVEGAKTLLEENGWIDSNGDGIREKNGINASFKLYYMAEELDRQSVSVLLSEQARELGIDIQLEGKDKDTVYDNMYSSSAYWQQSSISPYDAVYQQFHSKEPDNSYFNPNLYNNSEVDQLLEQALETTDLEEANSYWSQAALTSNGGGYGPAGDAPWLWIATYDFVYFVRDGMDINQNRPDNVGNDILVNVLDWK